MSLHIDNAVLIFSGEVNQIQRTGNKVTASCGIGPALLDNPLPALTKGKLCNHVKGSNSAGTFLISTGCTLLKDDWKFTAKIGAPISSAYPYTVYLTNLARVAGAAPTFFVNWFGFGRIEWGVGADLQRRSIIASTVPVAGALSVVIHRYFGSLPPLNADVVLYPGCPGTTQACKAYDATDNPTGKFDNYVNFGGSPFTPAGNPSTSGQPNLNLGGGKK